MTSRNEGIAIVGAGQAGLQTAMSLRQHGFEGSVAIIGEEAHPPYQRPPLSKKYLAGEMSAERLALRPPAFFADAGIALELGRRVTAVDPVAHRLVLADGGSRGYGTLVLATGTRARTVAIPGIGLDGVLTLRTIADVDRLRPHLGAGRKAAILGGGYIGLEFAAVARTLGLEVSVFEAAERVMQRVVSPEVSAFFEALHRGRGVAIHTGATVNRILGETRATGIETTARDVFDADLVLVAIGAEPNVTLAREAGLAVDNGIVVDGFGQTSHQDIFAAGDCTSFRSGLFGRAVRLESVQNAIDQAKAVAAALTGHGKAYDPVPWFWSDQYDVKLQIAGLSDGYDTADVRGDPDSGAFSVVYSADGRLIAVDSINQPRSHMLARRAIGGPVSAFDFQP